MSSNLADRAARGQFDDDVLEWIATGLAQFLAGNGELLQCLRLDRASLIRQRNQWLFEAASLLDDGSGPWPLAGRLADAIRHYQNQIAPLVRRNPFYPLGDIDRALYGAFSAGRPPISQRKLYDLLR